MLIVRIRTIYCQGIARTREQHVRSLETEQRHRFVGILHACSQCPAASQAKRIAVVELQELDEWQGKERPLLLIFQPFRRKSEEVAGTPRSPHWRIANKKSARQRGRRVNGGCGSLAVVLRVKIRGTANRSKPLVEARARVQRRCRHRETADLCHIHTDAHGADKERYT